MSFPYSHAQLPLSSRSDACLVLNFSGNKRKLSKVKIEEPEIKEKDIKKTETRVVFCNSSVPSILSFYCHLRLRGHNSSMQANDEG